MYFREWEDAGQGRERERKNYKNGRKERKGITSPGSSISSADGMSVLVSTLIQLIIFQRWPSCIHPADETDVQGPGGASVPLPVERGSAISHRGTSRTSGHLFKAAKAFLGETWENGHHEQAFRYPGSLAHQSAEMCFCFPTTASNNRLRIFSLKSPRNFFTSEQGLISTYANTYPLPQVWSVAPLLWLNALGAVCTWSLKQAKCYCRNGKYTMRMCQSQSFSLQVFICTQHPVSTGMDWETGNVLTLA